MAARVPYSLSGPRNKVDTEMEPLWLLLALVVLRHLAVTDAGSAACRAELGSQVLRTVREQSEPGSTYRDLERQTGEHLAMDRCSCMP